MAAKVDRELAAANKAAKKEALKLLYDGVTISQLAHIFHKNANDVQRILRNVEPAGNRNGIALYQLNDVAPYLVKPVFNIEQTLAKMRPNDLPPYLMKEYWAGQRTKQQFEKEAGELWSTEEVQLVCHVAFRNLRAGIQLMADQVEAQTEVTPKQRKLIIGMCDALLITLRKNLLKQDVSDDEEVEPEPENLLTG